MQQSLVKEKFSRLSFFTFVVFLTNDKRAKNDKGENFHVCRFSHLSFILPTTNVQKTTNVKSFHVCRFSRLSFF